MKKLRLFNTLSRQAEEFAPIEGNNVRMYICGPTVYGRAHLGNLRSYIFSDILRRVLVRDGYSVYSVQNITDVGHLKGDSDYGEDKVEKAAKESGESAWDIARKYEKMFKDDIALVNVMSPQMWSRATEHITEQIDFIRELEEKGFAYKAEDGVYFDTTKSAGYGAIAKLKLDDIKSGARVEPSPFKKNPTDFALWKISKPEDQRQMEWQSPWGTGFPGWHIECSAMSRKYLGFPFDIHCGGVDHVFPHHTNEIAQNEAAFGSKTVNYWLHNEFLRVESGRMGKSEGNAFSLEDLSRDGVLPIVFRFFCLGASYRQILNFTKDAILGAQEGYRSMVEEIASLLITSQSPGEVDATLSLKYTESFEEALNDDMNTPAALAVAWKVLRDTEIGVATKLSLIESFDQVLALSLMETANRIVPHDLPEDISQIVSKRLELRNDKRWEEADVLRKQLETMGYIVRDEKASTLLLHNLFGLTPR